VPGKGLCQQRERGCGPDGTLQSKNKKEAPGPVIPGARNIRSWHTLGVAAILSAAVTSL
jgi:hypothetical protein